MALIECPECGRKVSDRAVSCPDCGCPIADEFAQAREVARKHGFDIDQNGMAVLPYPDEVKGEPWDPDRGFYFLNVDEDGANLECKVCEETICYDVAFFKKIKSDYALTGEEIYCPDCDNSVNGLVYTKRECKKWLDSAVVSYGERDRFSMVAKSGVTICLNCGSVKLRPQPKGFGYGKAAVGGVLLGPLGLLVGGAGSKKVCYVCEKCGKKWNPGDGYPLIP